MTKRKILLNRTKFMAILMSILWILLIPFAFYFAMEKNGVFRLQHDKDPLARR